MKRLDVPLADRFTPEPSPTAHVVKSSPTVIESPRTSAIERHRIERDEFGRAWASLCQRYNREPDVEEAKLYHDYLERHGFDTATALRALRALWATSRFFPRPADFLLVPVEGDWRKLVALAHSNPAGTTDEQVAHYRDAWKEIGRRSREVIDSLGGLDGIRRSKDLGRTRRDFLTAYEAAVAYEATIR